MKKKTRIRIYNILQWTWGLPQTLAGAGLYLKHRKDPHFDYNGARVTAWNSLSGVSLGKFIFVPGKKGWSTIQLVKQGAQDAAASAGEDSVSRFLLEHEYGHTIQSLIFGPAYLLVIGMPSFAWNRLKFFERRRKKTGRSYYSAVFERTANTLGAKAARTDHTRRTSCRICDTKNNWITQ